jgi:hypothetical protein
VPTLPPSTHFVFLYSLQLHFRGHFRVHFCTSTPTFICGRTATFSWPFSCTFSYIHAYIHLWTHSDVSILHLHSSVDVQRSLQCYSYNFAASFVYIFVHLRLHSSVDAQRRRHSTPTFICGCTTVSTVLQLHFRGHFRVHFRTSTPTSSRPITCLVFKVAKSAWLHFTHQTETSLFSTFFTFYILHFSGPSLALFSRWQRVHGYTSLIRPRLHFSLHSTSTLSEHFRDSTILYHKHFRKLLWVLSNAICCG